MMTIRVRKIKKVKYDNKDVLNIYINQFCKDATKVIYYSSSELAQEINGSGAFAIRLIGTNKRDCDDVRCALEKQKVKRPFLYSKKWND